jgi:hypothetical protein
MMMKASGKIKSSPAKQSRYEKGAAILEKLSPGASQRLPALFNDVEIGRAHV